MLASSRKPAAWQTPAGGCGHCLAACRGRFHIGPPCLAANENAVETVGDDARIVPQACGAANSCGRGMPLPYKPSGRARPNGMPVTKQASVGRDASSRRTPPRRKRCRLAATPPRALPNKTARGPMQTAGGRGRSCWCVSPFASAGPTKNHHVSDIKARSLSFQGR